MKKAIEHLRQRADEMEAIGIGQFKRSANHTDSYGYTDFTNARIWGAKAAAYREAALELEKLK